MPVWLITGYTEAKALLMVESVGLGRGVDVAIGPFPQADSTINKLWRRRRLAQHDLDPNLVDAIRHEKDAKMHEDYIRRFGPRPEEAKRQGEQQSFV